MHPITIVRFRAADTPELIAQAWRLRHRVFREALGWEVPTVDLLEFDPFDGAAKHCAALQAGRMVGYWRALCTQEPYLLQRSFPDLLGGAAPRSPRVWEISRFAVLPDHADRREIGRLMVRELAAFGRDMGASRLIAVTDLIFERFVKQCGLRIGRVAGPAVVGRSDHGDVKAVVIDCEINARTLAGVGLQTTLAA